jgi:hypothetical protein
MVAGGGAARNPRDGPKRTGRPGRGVRRGRMTHGVVCFCRPCRGLAFSLRLPGVTLRSTPGYHLAALRAWVRKAPIRASTRGLSSCFLSSCFPCLECSPFGIRPVGLDQSASCWRHASWMSAAEALRMCRSIGMNCWVRASILILAGRASAMRRPSGCWKQW